MKAHQMKVGAGRAEHWEAEEPRGLVSNEE